MTAASKITYRVDSEGNKVPRIAIMGEFSAGKSTLCNMLMNGDTLPRKVTATQLAPVWMTKGDGAHVRVKTDGSETPIEMENLSSIPTEDTLYIRLGLPQEIFDHFDLIDFPGISDPNMDPDVWSRLLDEADAVIWLTHATQAWRQTEAAVWDMVSEDVQANSLLLLTRWDKVTSNTDRMRIQRRLERETKGLFKDVLPISLLAATNAGEDYDAWNASGAEAFMSSLTDIVTALKTRKTDAPLKNDDVKESAKSFEQRNPSNDTYLRVSNSGPAQTAPPDVAAKTSRVLPRRVVASALANRDRPRTRAN